MKKFLQFSILITLSITFLYASDIELAPEENTAARVAKSHPSWPETLGIFAQLVQDDVPNNHLSTLLRNRFEKLQKKVKAEVLTILPCDKPIFLSTEEKTTDLFTRLPQPLQAEIICLSIQLHQFSNLAINNTVCKTKATKRYLSLQTTAKKIKTA